MKKLYNYQQEIVDRSGESTALFLDMGLGKTITSIEIIKKYHRTGEKTLVICPKSMIKEWVFELANQGGLVAEEYKKYDPQIHDCLVINHELVWRRLIGEFDHIIIDESHRIKNPNSKIGRFVRKLQARVKIILTGTPQSQGFIDYYNQLYFLGYMTMSFPDFKNRYCIYEQKTDWKSGKTYMSLEGYQNVQEFEDLYLSKCEFLKVKQVYDDIIKEHYINIPTTPAYNRAVRDKVIYYNNDKVVFDRKEIEKYLKLQDSTITHHIMLDNSGAYRYGIRSLLDKTEWLKDFLDGYNDRVVIFYNYNVELDQLLHVVGNRPHSIYNGEFKDLSTFITNKDGVALCNYGSASVGLNDLVHSNIFIAYSPTENYILWEQSKKRIDRIGQENTPIYYFLQSGIEYNIYKTLRSGKNFDDKVFKTIIPN